MVSIEELAETLVSLKPEYGLKVIQKVRDSDEVYVENIHLKGHKMYWDTFNARTAPMIIGIFFLGAVQLIFMGLIGEYILSMNKRIMKRPLVVEEERSGFDEVAETK